MSITDQLTQLRDALQAWAAKNKGAAEVASDPAHLFALLAQKPAGIRVALLFTGETAREPQEGGFVDRTFLIVLTQGRGFQLPEQALTTTAGRRPMFEFVEEARQLLRGVQFESETTEVTPDFRSIGLFTLPDGTPVDAYQIEIAIGVQLPAPE